MKNAIMIAVAIGFSMFGQSCISGCGLVDSHVKQFDELRGLATEAATRLNDGSVGQFQVGGQAIDPGIEVSARIEYAAVAKYVGMAGQFQAGGSGTMGPQSNPQAILDIINDKKLTDEQRRNAIIELIQSWSGSATKPAE